MSGINTVTMPKWGMEMVEGEIAEWHVSEGDSIVEGDDLLDVETSKIVNTVTAPASGVVRRLLGAVGEIVAVGKTLAVIAPADVPDDEIERLLAGAAASAPENKRVDAPAAEPPQPRSAPAATPEQAPGKVSGGASAAGLSGGGDDSGVAATPVARRVARAQGINLNQVPASGRHGRVTLADIEAILEANGRHLEKPHSSARPEMRSQRDDSKVSATPVARRLARELGVNLLDCRRSGRHGRVSKADVEAAAPRASVDSGAAGRADAQSPSRVESRALSGMRRTIAARLQGSKRDAPHFRVQVDVEVDALLAVREELNRRYSEAKVSLNDLLVKASACALVAVPGVNVQFDGETVQRFGDADIAVAVALDDGLITPIVRGANHKGVVAISNEVRDLATRARLGTLRPEEFQGGSFSISNLGMFGVDRFDAIINAPQGAILAVGAAEQKPVVRQGELAVATVLTLTLSSDHRIIDGALAARFLSALRGFLETPATMLA
jgi:pyruvate dehydrogenase E2 component (dihydrolipoamide acetyltransferase)